MKKALIISAFDSYGYEVRNKYIERYLEELGYRVYFVSSNFDHRTKSKYSVSRENLVLLHVPSYKKNISFGRIWSHFIFAKKARKYAEKIGPQIIYAGGPPNSLFKEMSKYRHKHASCRLIMEIGDMWPETLPVSRRLKKVASPILYLWASIRNTALKGADGIVFECNLFRDALKKYYPGIPSRTLYLSKTDSLKNSFNPQVSCNPLKIAYLGSINNIVDIDLIVQILLIFKANFHVVFEIIGDGEKKPELLKKCKDLDITYHDHGIVYDDHEKYRILNDCQFGLNIMKDSVMVGATMKSLEYFYYGLGVINNIGGDTKELIEQNLCGYNINNDNMYNLANEILNLNDFTIMGMRVNSHKLYEKVFSENANKEAFTLFLKDILNSGEK